MSTPHRVPLDNREMHALKVMATGFASMGFPIEHWEGLLIRMAKALEILTNGTDEQRTSTECPCTDCWVERDKTKPMADAARYN